MCFIDGGDWLLDGYLFGFGELECVFFGDIEGFVEGVDVVYDLVVVEFVW